MAAEFSDAEALVVEVPSTWRQNATAVSTASSTQCDLLREVQASTQTNEPQDAETQTGDVAMELYELFAPEPTDLLQIDGEIEDFLEKTLPLVEGYLGAQRSALVQEEDAIVQQFVEAVQANQRRYRAAQGGAGPAGAESDLFRVVHELEREGETGCTSVSWNASGVLLAVGHGHMDHVGWCTHASYLRVWNVLKGSSEAEVEVSSCIMSIAFHPKNAGLVAGGLFNGEVRLWDVTQADDANEPLLASSHIDDLFHREPIGRVEWLEQSNTLATISSDGRVLFWSVPKLEFPVEGFCLTPTRQYHGHGAAMNRYGILGGTALAFSSESLNFVVGTEGGGLLKCLRQSATGGSGSEQPVRDGEFKWTPSAQRLVRSAPTQHQFDVKRHIEKHARLNALDVIRVDDVYAARPVAAQLYSDPVSFAYEAHDGPVYAIAFSPFHRNVFVSASTDGTVRLYNMMHPSPLLRMQPDTELVDVAWSPARPLVLAAATASGWVLVYDLLLTGVKQPAVRIRCNKEGQAVNAVRFNHRDGSLLACVDARGVVSVIELGDQFTEVQPGEQDVLESLGEAGGGDAGRS